MALSHLTLGRSLVDTNLHAVLAPRREGTALGRVDQVHGVSLDGDQALMLVRVILGTEASRPQVYGCLGS